jgi:hypothetical protein
LDWGGLLSVIHAKSRVAQQPTPPELILETSSQPGFIAVTFDLNQNEANAQQHPAASAQEQQGHCNGGGSMVINDVKNVSWLDPCKLQSCYGACFALAQLWHGRKD